MSRGSIKVEKHWLMQPKLGTRGDLQWPTLSDQPTGTHHLLCVHVCMLAGFITVQTYVLKSRWSRVLTVSLSFLTSPGSQCCLVGSVPSSQVGGSLGPGWSCGAPCPAGSGGAWWRYETVHLPQAKTGEEDSCSSLELRFYVRGIYFIYSSCRQHSSCLTNNNNKKNSKIKFWLFVLFFFQNKVLNTSWHCIIE